MDFQKYENALKNNQNLTLISLKVSPECIQIQRTPDGRSTGDVLVSFFNRCEAERAILEKNHQTIGNRIVELYLAV